MEMKMWDEKILSKFTHYASFYGIPVLYNVETCEIIGENKFYDILFTIAINIYSVLELITSYCFPNYESPGFPLTIYNEIFSEETVIEVKLDG
jgi:hypothetical protein